MFQSNFFDIKYKELTINGLSFFRDYARKKWPLRGSKHAETKEQKTDDWRQKVSILGFGIQNADCWGLTQSASSIVREDWEQLMDNGSFCPAP